MKTYVLLWAAVWILCFPAGVPADEKPAIITYYNMTKGDEDKIRFVDGKWRVFVRGMPAESPIIDIENGYLEFIDPGTGGGSTKVTAALFLGKKREPMLAEFHERYGTGGCPDPLYALRSYRLRQGKMAEGKDFLPAIQRELFFKKGYDPKRISAYLPPHRDWSRHIGYRLPRFGTTMEVFLYAGDLQCSLERFAGEMSDKEREAVREYIEKLRKEPVLLKWNVETGAFDPPGEG